MKFGLIVNIGTDNIGDDIQSYAARRFLPTIDYVIDRENLDTFQADGQRVKAIMNGWYMYNKFNWPPAAEIDPLWISIHIAEQDYFGIGDHFLDGIGGDYLRHFAPIGARDESTLAMLNEKRIPAFLSGCLTLTIPQFKNIESTDEVLLVDIDKKSKAAILEMYPAENIQFVTHSVDTEEYSRKSIDARLQEVEALLRRYQAAKCVITGRLHCALPCLALGTPVFLIYKGEYAPRMQSFLKFLHYSPVKELKDGIRNFNPPQPIENSDSYLPIRDALIDRCQSFISEKDNSDPFAASLQEIHLWQKSLMRSADFTVRKEIGRLTSWISDLDRGKKYLEKQCRCRDARIAELQLWNDQLEDGKHYLENQVAAKDARIAELQLWNDQLEDGKHYLENQVAAKDARIAELEQWAEQLDAGKAYLEQQCTAKDHRISELESWCQSVSDGKEYIETQWNAEKEARARGEAMIAELSQQLDSLQKSKGI